jgi:hypothetical protein
MGASMKTTTIVLDPRQFRFEMVLSHLILASAECTLTTYPPMTASRAVCPVVVGLMLHLNTS